MKINSLTTVISTQKLAESRNFYVQNLGFKVIFENDWYVQLRSSNDSVDLAFVLPNHETQPPIFQSEFSGKGVFYTIEVNDVDAELARLQKSGIDIVFQLKNEPWGERHFAIVDPNGVAINISHLIEPSKEYLQYFVGT